MFVFKDCRFIKANGLKCKSPAMRGSPFCYFHARTRVVVPRRPRGPKEEPVNLPVLSDGSGVLAVLNEILQALASNRISPKRAGSLLYALQMARPNLETTPPDVDDCIPRPTVHAVLTTNHSPLITVFTRRTPSAPPASS